MELSFDDWMIVTPHSYHQKFLAQLINHEMLTKVLDVLIELGKNLIHAKPLRLEKLQEFLPTIDSRNRLTGFRFEDQRQGAGGF